MLPLIKNGAGAAFCRKAAAPAPMAGILLTDPVWDNSRELLSFSGLAISTRRIATLDDGRAHRRDDCNLKLDLAKWLLQGN
jgi:hypothetical protein